MIDFIIYLKLNYKIIFFNQKDMFMREFQPNLSPENRNVTFDGSTFKEKIPSNTKPASSQKPIHKPIPTPIHKPIPTPKKQNVFVKIASYFLK